MRARTGHAVVRAENLEVLAQPSGGLHYWFCVTAGLGGPSRLVGRKDTKWRCGAASPGLPALRRAVEIPDHPG